MPQVNDFSWIWFSFFILLCLYSFILFFHFFSSLNMFSSVKICTYTTVFLIY